MRNYIEEWKNKVRFLAIGYDEFIEKFDKISDLYFLEKLDGQSTAAVYDRKECFFQTPVGSKIEDIPAVYEYKTILEKLKVKSAVFVGELVAQKMGTILSFAQSESVIKTSYKPENAEIIHLYLFDILELDGKPVSFPAAIKFLTKNFSNKTTRLHIPNVSRGGVEEFRQIYQRTIQKGLGFEGIIIRLPNGRALKVKPTLSFDLALLGAGNLKMRTWPKGHISYLISAFMDRKGIFRLTSRVGTGFDFKQRSELFKYVNNEYIIEKNNELFVPPTRVIEVEFQNYDIQDMPSYNFTKGTYEETGKKLSTSMRFPRFSRFRDDKKITVNDLRLEQIPQFPTNKM